MIDVGATRSGRVRYFAVKYADGSLSFEDGLALFDEGARTFFGVLAGKNSASDFIFNLEAILQRQP
jgi:hypothetical protein